MGVALEDKLLINELKKGNRAVFESIFQLHYLSLVKFADQFLLDTDASKDVVQSVFIYLWENSRKIRIEKSLLAYLFQSVKNKCLNHLRSLKIKDKYELSYVEALINSYEEDKLEDELILEIKEVLQKLPTQMYEIFCMKYLHEQSIREIAEQLSISENTVKVHLFKGRNKVREMLQHSTNCIFFL
uniref:RNA polymerase sigma factor n=1 Tax=uncultured Draconibacterium sp. TaxID=1573823 RepID=UPI0032172E2C